MTSSPSPGSPGLPAPDPDIRVLGDATAEEVAAVLAVLASASAADTAAPTPRRTGSSWASHAAALRTPPPRGRGAWRGAPRP